MKAACVRFDDGSRVWAGGDEIEMATLDRVRVRLPEGEREGTVLVAPRQVIQGSVECLGTVLERLNVAADAEIGRLPGSELPPLGSQCVLPDGAGVVTGIDPLAGTVTVTLASSESPTLNLADFLNRISG